LYCFISFWGVSTIDYVWFNTNFQTKTVILLHRVSSLVTLQDTVQFKTSGNNEDENTGHALSAANRRVIQAVRKSASNKEAATKMSKPVFQPGIVFRCCRRLATLINWHDIAVSERRKG
jgi:hypothetical protein